MQSPYFGGPSAFRGAPLPGGPAGIRSLTPTGLRLPSDPSQQLFQTNSNNVRSMTPPPKRVSHPVSSSNDLAGSGTKASKPPAPSVKVESAAAGATEHPEKTASKILKPPSMDDELVRRVRRLAQRSAQAAVSRASSNDSRLSQDHIANGSMISASAQPLPPKSYSHGGSPARADLSNSRDRSPRVGNRSSVGASVRASLNQQKQIAELKAQNQKLSRDLVSAQQELRQAKSSIMLLERELRAARERIQHVEDDKRTHRTRSRSPALQMKEQSKLTGQDVHQMLMQQVENAEHLLASTTASVAGDGSPSSGLAPDTLSAVDLHNSAEWLQSMGIAASSSEHSLPFVYRSSVRADAILLGLVEEKTGSILGRISGVLSSLPVATLRDAPEEFLQDSMSQVAILGGTNATMVLLLYNMGEEGSGRWMFVAHMGEAKAVLAYRKSTPEKGAFAVTCLTKDRPEDGSVAVQGYQLRPGTDVMLMIASSAVASQMTNKQMAFRLLRGGLSTVEEITSNST
ncbi:hypothetical protein FOL47_010993, partial [Perkinsus chesapeaki]